jgi:hypothetical protein
MTVSYDTYISLTHTATDEIDDDGNIIRDMPDLSSEYYEYMHKWFVDLIVFNPKHKEVLGGVLEAFCMSFSPIEGTVPFDEEYIEDHIASILSKFS